jgi:excisionase family DNA binding protein
MKAETMTDLPDSPPQLLTVPETAEKLKLSERAVWRLLAGRKLPAVKLGRAVRIDQADLVTFVESLKA